MELNTTKTKTAARMGAAAVALGLSLAGPQAMGIASADSPDTDSASASGVTAPSKASPAREPVARRSATERTGRASASSARRGAQRVEPDVAAVPPAVVPAVTATGRGQSGPSAPAEFVGSGLLDPAATAQSESGHSALAGPAAVDTPAADPVGLSQPAPAAASENDAAPPVGGEAIAEVSTPMASLPTPSALAVASIPEPPAATATPSGVLRDINTAVVSVFDATQNWLAALPANPFSDLLEGALLLLRRSLFNQTPTVDPVQIKTTVTGQILGTLRAIDPEGDALTYSLTEAPQLGTVQVSPDGTYTYTPGADFSEGDSFTVAVNDGGFNILDPLGNWRPAQATVEVLGAPGGPPEGALAKPAISRTFQVTNLTSTNQQLVSFAKASNTQTSTPEYYKPAIGTIIEPGESMTFSITQWAFVTNVNEAQFIPVDANGDRLFGVGNAGFLVRMGTQQAEGSYTDCRNRGNCYSSDRRTLQMLDFPGTVISVSGAQAQKQADVLNRLCSQEGNPGNCTFKPKSFDDMAKTDWKQTSTTVTNTGTTNIVRTLTSTSTQTTSSTLGASLTAKGSILKIVELSVTASASRTWTSSYTFTDQLAVTIAPGQKAWLETRDPISRVTGDFFVTLRNTTWNLYDVSFDSPASDGRFGDLIARCDTASGSCLPADQVPD